MGKETEAKILEPFKARAEKGEKVEISEIAEAYQAAVVYPVGGGQIYCMLKRHGWRKVMPRSRHLKKAREEVIAASKSERKSARNGGKRPQFLWKITRDVPEWSVFWANQQAEILLV